MKFCKKCGRSMVADFMAVDLIFKCPACSEIEIASDDDVSFGIAQGAVDAAVRFAALIRNAPFDRTNQNVSRDCSKCGMDYMAMVNIGEDQIILFICECGQTESAGRS